MNMKDVTYIDSGGLGTLYISLYSSARALGGDVKLARLERTHLELLQITKLVTVFDIHNTETGASAGVRQRRRRRLEERSAARPR